MPRYLDDFAPGQAFESPRRTITETDIVNFAALTGDWNPVHTDAVFAALCRSVHGRCEQA